jgi:hypothetical protein
MRAFAGWMLLVSGASVLLAQQPATGPEAAKQAVATWLQSGMSDEQLLGKTVKAVLDGGDAALQWFGGELATATDQTEARTKGLQAVGTHVCLDFVKRAVKSDMVFAGQYDPLRPLLPFAGGLFLKLLLQTPDWYPDTFRAQLVPPLRDLFPQSPGQSEVLGMIELVKNVAVEPENLRVQLALGLFQWGHPEFVQPVLDRWRQASGDGDAGDRVEALRMLADLQYQLRQYGQSANTHRLMEALAAKSGVPLWPTDLYASACVHALSGDLDKAIAEFEQCIGRQTSGTVDPSLHIKQKVFELDPEIKSLRGTERYRQAMQKAFPGKTAAGKGPPDEEKGKDR